MQRSTDHLVPEPILPSEAQLEVPLEDLTTYPRLREAYAKISSEADSFDALLSAFLVPEDVLLKHVVEEHLSLEVLQIYGTPLFDIQACHYRKIDLKGLGEIISENVLSSLDPRHQSLLAKTLNLILSYQPDVRSIITDPSLIDTLARNPIGPLDSIDMAFPACQILYEQLLEEIGGIPG